MWTYHQQTGDLEHNGQFVGTGYSGAGHVAADGRNNPDMQGDPDKGPIPRGSWIIGKPRWDNQCGPLTMDLTPAEGTDALGRSLFRIHGNNTADDASHGCIILGRPIRELVAASGDTALEVVL